MSELSAVEVRCVSPHAERPEWVPAAWGWAPDEEPWLIMPGRSDGTLHPCAWHTLKCFASMDVAGRQVCIVGNVDRASILRTDPVFFETIFKSIIRQMAAGTEEQP